VELFIEDGKLKCAWFEKPSLQNFPESILIKSLMTLGNAKIQKINKRVTGTVVLLASEKDQLPSYDDVSEILGDPYRYDQTEQSLTAYYRYIIFTSPDNKTPRKIYAKLIFNDSGNLQMIEGKISGITIQLHYEIEQ